MDLPKITVEMWRKAYGMSKEFVASALGISVNTYSAREESPGDFTIAQAHKLAEVFKVPLEFIFFT